MITVCVTFQISFAVWVTMVIATHDPDSNLNSVRQQHRVQHDIDTRHQASDISAKLKMPQSFPMETLRCPGFEARTSGRHLLQGLDKSSSLLSRKSGGTETEVCTPRRWCSLLLVITGPLFLTEYGRTPHSCKFECGSYQKLFQLGRC